MAGLAGRFGRKRREVYPLAAPRAPTRGSREKFCRTPAQMRDAVW
jgi:hypothetical protein